MLPLDHIPLQTADLSRLRDTFETLGFTVTPPGAYTSPDFPDARWPNRCVFLRQGWFDLLEAPGLDPAVPVTPRGALFRTDDLDAAIGTFSDLRMEPPYRLERRWDRDLGLPAERFRLFSLRERVAPIALAVIEHAWPCPDILPAWTDHPNGALLLDGLIFGDAAPGPAAGQCEDRLDLSTFNYLDAGAFDARFGPMVRPTAVRICVRDLSQTAEALARRGLAHAWSEHGVSVVPLAPLGCAFLFSEEMR
jgi:hypothetical protein